MNNLNTEEDEVNGGGGGGGWWASCLSLGAAGGAAAALVWKLYQSKKQQVEELEGAIRIYQGYVEQDQQEKLAEVENLLVERQHAFCSNFKRHRYRHELEEKILRKASALESVIPDMSDTVRRIFTEDRHCGSTLSYVHTRDKRNNGCLMWEEMKNWRRMVKNSGQS